MKISYLLLVTIIAVAMTTTVNGQTVTGSGTLNYVPKFSSTGSTIGNSSIFDNGSVGIGTTNPQSPLHLFVNNSSAYSATTQTNAQLSLTNINQTNTSYSRLLFNTNDASGALASGASISALFTNHTTSQVSADLIFQTKNAGTNAEVARFMSDGKVGIGTSAPGSILSVLGASNSSTAHASFGSTQWRMKINSGDEVNSGTIDYRGFDPNALGIVGAGTGANRLIRMWEFVGINTTPSTNQALNVSGSGATYAAVFQNGSVGIGTTTPLYPLHVKKADNAVGGTGILVENTDAGNNAAAGIKFRNSLGASSEGSLAVASSSQPNYGAVVANNLVLYTINAAGIALMADVAGGSIRFATGGNTERMRVNSDGKVGIGTAAPAELLHVWGATGANGVIKISSNNGFTNNFLKVVDGVGNGLQIQRGDGTTEMAFDNTNLRVGIGTTTPTQKLEVAGTVYSTTGGFKFPDGTTQTTAVGNNPTFETVHVLSSFKIGNSIMIDQPGNNIYTDDLSPAAPLLIQSNATYPNNTIINANNIGVVGIGTTTPSQKLEVAGMIYSNTGGFKFPDGTTQTTAYTGTNAAAWLLTGNGGTNPLTDFMGTTDAKDLVFKTDGIEHMRITSSGHVPTPDHPGNVGIGTDDPEKKLHVLTKHTTCALCPPQTHEGIRLEEQTTYTDLPGNPTDISVWDLQPLGSGFGIKNPTGIAKLFISSTGNIGIGTTAPLQKLQVNGSISIYDGDGNTSLFFGAESVPSHAFGKWGIQYVTADQLGSGTPGGLNFWVPTVGGNATPGNAFLFLADNGNVGIGTTTCQNNKLEVNGTIRSKEWIVELNNWCDFKFEPNYQRMTWQEKLDYIQEKKHLPEIAPAIEISNEGLKVSKTLYGFLWNIEDNTMDIIDLKKENEELKKVTNEQSIKLAELERKLEILSNRK